MGNLLHASKDCFHHFNIKIQGTILQLSGWGGQLGRFQRSSARKTGYFANKFFVVLLLFSFLNGTHSLCLGTHTFSLQSPQPCVRVSVLWIVSKDNGGGCEWLTKSFTLWEALHEHEIWVWPLLLWVHLKLGHETQYVPFEFLNVYIMQKNMCRHVTAKI